MPELGTTAPIPINIINLDRDEERWEEVNHELSRNGVPKEQIQRIPAVYGKNLSKEELQHNTTLFARLFCTPGMIGCYLSHRKLWEKVSRESEPWQLVLEDDVVIIDKTNNFCDLVNEAIDEVQQNEEFKGNWDVLMIGAIGPVHPEGRHGIGMINATIAGGGRKQRKVTEHVQVPHRPFATHGYVITKSGAKKLLEKAWTVAGHVDSVIWGIQDLNLLIRNPMLVHQNMDADSTIGVDPWGPETWLPDTIKADGHSGITLNWALSEPIIRIPGTTFVITVGRGGFIVFFGFLAGILFHRQVPWLLPVHTAIFLSGALLLRIMSKAVGRPSASQEGLLASPLPTYNT